MSALVRAAVVRLADAADELRRIGCASHDSRAILFANRVTAGTYALLAECETNTDTEVRCPD